MERGVTLLGLAWVVMLTWRLRRDQDQPAGRGQVSRDVLSAAEAAGHDAPGEADPAA